MRSLEGNDFTLVELKDALRERGLSTKGAKAELIQRLSEQDPNVWTILGERLNKMPYVEDASTSSAVGRGATEEQTDAETREECPGSVPLVLERQDDHVQRELMLIRRERELIEREQQLLRGERETTRSASATSNGLSTMGSYNVRNLRDLLPEFDASDNTFWRWRNQLELLRNSYQLDDSSTRILISSRLKGRALTWFYSKAEYLTLSIENLLEEMKQMFDLRPGMLALRKEFEARVWKTSEQLCDYYHEKVILANRVPIAEAELLDYIIDGILDMSLQDQARIRGFQSRTELLKAFEKIKLGPKRYHDFKPKTDGVKSSTKTEVSSVRGKPAKCYRCHEEGHIATQCKRPAARTTKRECYVCGSSEHVARYCPKRKQPATSKAGGTSAETTSTNLIQPDPLPKPYMVTLRINPSEKCGKVDTYVMDAIIDSGSPISMIRDSIVENEICTPIIEGASQFCGLNGSRLKILSIFHGEVEIQGARTKIKFYTVPDNTMAYKVLLGRDFLSCPALRITLGEVVEIENVEETSVKQVLNVETNEGPDNVRDELRINPAIKQDKIEKIHEIYESRYFRNFQAEKCGPDFEMSISLKHNQPISSRPRRLSFADKEALRKILDELSEKGIIRVSNSPYASPIVLVKKKPVILDCALIFEN